MDDANIPEGLPAMPPALPRDEDALHGDRMVLNMGPSHPSTHGVLRLVLTLEGEIVKSVQPHLGYLHRGMEKIAETMTYHQFIPYTDRLDYLAPLSNNVAFILAVEKLMDIKVPPRADVIRLICCEIARISAHLLWLGTAALDLGGGRKEGGLHRRRWAARSREMGLSQSERNHSAVPHSRHVGDVALPGGQIANLKLAEMGVAAGSGEDLDHLSRCFEEAP